MPLFKCIFLLHYSSLDQVTRACIRVAYSLLRLIEPQSLAVHVWQWPHTDALPRVYDTRGGVTPSLGSMTPRRRSNVWGSSPQLYTRAHAMERRCSRASRMTLMSTSASTAGALRAAAAMAVASSGL